jgi:uncharacterized protein HemX
MKRMIGSIAAIVLALSLGVATYGKATPKQNSGTKTATSAPSTTKQKHSKKKHKRTRRTGHHKMQKSAKMNNQKKVGKTNARKS